MGKLFWITDNDTTFPPSERALTNPNGLLAVGGDLSPTRLLQAYQRGIFPWFEEGQPVLWWTPDPRMVLFPDECHVSRSLKRLLRKNPFELSADTVFAAIVDGCAAPRAGTAGTWITPKMREAYLTLHEMGCAHSIEVWESGQLVGGIYGVVQGAVFFGESMFSRRANASKVAFATLAQKLHYWGYRLLDCQMPNDHLFTLGAREIPRREFETILRESMGTIVGPADWREAWSAMPR